MYIQLLRAEREVLRVHLELPAAILLSALEENLHSSMLLRETFGCGWRAGGRAAPRGAPWRLLCWRGSPMLEASDGARSNSHACVTTGTA